jgi:hypothetical protein
MSEGLQPETIVDQPIPLLTGSTTQSTGSSSSDGQSPLLVKDAPIKRNVIAVDTISTSLDTQSRAIKGAYVFEQMGSLQIGTFVSGTSGQLLISPDGLTATNSSGDTTFAIDGITGDATFKGTVQAGSLISGSLIIGGNNNNEGTISVLDASNVEKVLIDKDGITITDGKLTIQNSSGTTIIDSTGLVSTANFLINSTTQTTSQDITTQDTWTDLNGDELTLVVDRDTQLLIMFQAEFAVNATDFASDYYAQGQFAISIDGTRASYVTTTDQQKVGTMTPGENDAIHMHVVSTLAAGSHTIKGQGRIHKFSGFDPGLYIRLSTLSYIQFGK